MPPKALLPSPGCGVFHGMLLSALSGPTGPSSVVPQLVSPRPNKAVPTIIITKLFMQEN